MDEPGSITLSQLPDEMLTQILRQMDHKGVCRMAQVNQLLRKLAMEDEIWYSLYQRHYGPVLASPEQLRMIRSWKAVYFRKFTFNANPDILVPQRHIAVKGIITTAAAIGIVVLCALCIPILLALLLTFSFRSVRIVKQFYTWKTQQEPIGELAKRMLSQIFTFFLVDTLSLVGSAYAANYLVLFFLYRVPQMIREQWELDDTKIDLNVEWKSNLSVVRHFMLTLGDLFIVPLLGIPLLLTVHRLPSLLSTARTYSTKELLSTKLYSLLWTEFKQMTTCGSGAMGQGCALLTKGLVGLCQILLCVLFAVAALAMVNHRTLQMFVVFSQVTSLRDCTKRLAILFFTAIVEYLCSCGATYPFFYIVLLAIYRVPYLVIKLKSRTQSFDRSMSVAWLVCFHAFCVILEVVFIPISFVIILLTLHRLPHLIYTLRTTPYTQAMHNLTLIKIFGLEFVRVFTCAKAPSGTPAVCGVLGKVLLCLLCVVLLGPCALVLLLTCSHHSVRLAVRLRAISSLVEFAQVVGTSILAFFSELLIGLGLPLVSWFLVMVTVYRAPILLSKMVKEGQKLGPTSVPEPSWATAGQGGLIFADLFSLVFILLPILLTVHRVPALFRRLAACTYQDLTSTSIGAVFWQEFRLIGFCERKLSEEDKVVDMIVTQSSPAPGPAIDA
eukprot:TRINITY_DN12301_c0_g1_i1.p1 TRINITY_DN12301_c0_g1~~TRINITY_DN12301_c0_g1_i1.p1  ORF type:complete len:668 (-),score=113.25 TRINITY_DN12301_c0_g1_i1:73-2076(-)